jgi:hypothetical protein
MIDSFIEESPLIAVSTMRIVELSGALPEFIFFAKFIVGQMAGTLPS